MAKRAEKLSETSGIYQQMRQLLMGKDRVVQATAITEVAAVWIYGHSPELRPALMEALMLQIIHVVEKLDEEQPWPPQQH